MRTSAWPAAGAQFRTSPSAWLRPGLGDANPNVRSPPFRGSAPRPVQESAAIYEVEAVMTPQNVSRPLSNEAAAAFPVPRPGMALAAEAFTQHQATARSSSRAGAATIIARRRLNRMHGRARRIFNVHAHADRRAPPGGDPGRSRQGKPDRGI